MSIQPKQGTGKYFDAIFQSRNIAISVLDLNLRFKAVNESFLQLIQQKEGDLQQGDFLRLLNFNDQQQFLSSIENLKKGNSSTFEQEISVRQNSNRILLNIEVQRVHNEDDQLAEYIITANELKSPPITKINADIILGSVLAATNELIFLTDNKMQITAYNEAFRKNLVEKCGIEPTRGMELNQFAEQFFDNQFLMHASRALRGEKISLSFENFIGHNRMVIQLHPIFQGEGDVVGFTTCCELKPNFKNLEGRNSGSVFQSVFDQSPIGIVISGNNKPILSNQQFCDMLGYTQKEIANMSLSDLSYTEDINIHTEAHQKLKEEEIEYFVVEKRYKSKFGAVVPARTTITKVRLDKNEKDTFVAFIEDLTDKQSIAQKAEELNRLRVKDAESEKEQEKMKAEVDLLSRKLSSNLMFISQRNALLESINQSLREISPKVDYEIRHELFKISSKVKSNIQLEDAWSKFKVHFDQTHPGFFNKLHETNAKLTQKETKQCAYVRMGLSNKETSQLLGVSPKSIEMARYRIKKKLELGAKDSLAKYLIKI